SGLGSRTAKLAFTTNDPDNATVSYDLTCEGEAASSLLVNTLDDEDGTNPNKCSLREAIKANNTGADFGGCANPKGTINFDPILNGNTIVLTAAPEPITKNVVVSGPGASSLTISGNDTHRVFNIAATNNPVVTIEKLTLTQGLATNANGGAILSDSTGLLTIDSVTISNSTATGATFGIGSGGGIRASTATVSNSTLSGNSAGSDGGGGISAFTVTVSNSTIVLNRSNFGGGIRRVGSGSFVVNNTIVAGNTNAAGTTANDISATFTSGSNNLIGTGGSGGLTNSTNGNIVGVTDINTVLNTVLEANSTLIQAGDPNTGTEPVLTHALVTGSQAINAGDNTLALDVNGTPLTTDQRGLTRIINTTVDIGSFEAQ
ncbi:MAG: choice-of-anchor Q domain-containing protein, partial [Cyanophyceae cyanobacterium]